jgi:alkyl hydroperoxide reductase subunit F
MYDVIIVGGGPAGMTAAIYASRKALSQVLISPDVGGQAAWASEIENYLGYPYVTGFDLAMKFEKHLKSFKVNMQDDRVATLMRDDRTFRVKTEGGQEHEGRCVIVCSGRSARNLGVPGEEEYKGRGVTYCATCDAPLYGGKDVAVVGGGNAGLDATIQLSRIAAKVYLIEVEREISGDKKYMASLRNAPTVQILTHTEVNEIRGSRFVESITATDTDTGDRSEIPVGGVFVEIGSMPNVGFLPPEIKVNKHGEIVVDCANHTSAEGVFAAGDVTNIPHKQIIIAAGEGSKAMLSADDYLIHHFPEICKSEEAPSAGPRAAAEMFRPILR